MTDRVLLGRVLDENSNPVHGLFISRPGYSVLQSNKLPSEPNNLIFDSRNQFFSSQISEVATGNFPAGTPTTGDLLTINFSKTYSSIPVVLVTETDSAGNAQGVAHSKFVVFGISGSRTIYEYRIYNNRVVIRTNVASGATYPQYFRITVLVGG